MNCGLYRPTDHIVKKKRNKYQDLAKEIFKIWKVEVSVIPFVVGGIRNNAKSIGKDMEIRGQVETVHTTALRSVRILRSVLET